MTIEETIKDRIIGRKPIVAIFKEMYDITTWPGAIKFIRSNNLPLRKTPSKRPMFYKHELLQYDVRFQEIFNAQKTDDNKNSLP